MSDYFGTFHAFKSMAEVYLRASRGSGRTKTLLEILKDGDRVIVLNSREGRELERRAHEKGMTISTRVLGLNTDEIYRLREPAKGNTYFDHRWVEEFIMHNLNHMEDFIENIQSRLNEKKPVILPPKTESEIYRKHMALWPRR